jgi:hypothetical protein
MTSPRFVLIDNIKYLNVIAHFLKSTSSLTVHME